LVHRKHETLRQYIFRARDEGLWEDDVSKEGLLVWLDKYEAVRFGGVELSEGEFLETMKLVYFLLMGMSPPEVHEEYPPVLSSSSSSTFSSESGNTIDSFVGDGENGLNRQTRSDAYVLKQMESLLTSPRKSGDSASLSSMIDHGSMFEETIDREERDRRMRGGRLGEREGSVIYYDVD
jgi:hypothetical protein